MPPRSDTRTLLTIAILAVALRAPGLLDRPIWLDEWLTLDRARGQIGAAQDWVPGAYAWGVWLMELGGAGPQAALRLPALLGAVLAVALAGWAATAWEAHKHRWAAALMVACAAGFVPYGHEGRPYAWAVAGSFAVFAALGPQGPRRSLVLVAVGLVGSVWTWTGMATCGVFCSLAALRDASRARWVALGVGLAALSTVPALVSVPVADLHTVGPAVSSWQAADALSFWWFGAVAARLPGSGVALLLVGTWLARREPPELLAHAWLPLVGLAGAWWVGLHPMGPVRHLLVLAPPWVVLVCRVATPPVWIALSAVGAGLALAMAPGVPHHDVRPLVGQVGDGGVLHVDPVLQRSWREAGGRSPDSGTWERPEPRFDGQPVWVVERAASGAGAPRQVDVRLQGQAPGVRLTVWLPKRGSTTAEGAVLEAPR